MGGKLNPTKMLQPKNLMNTAFQAGMMYANMQTGGMASTLAGGMSNSGFGGGFLQGAAHSQLGGMNPFGGGPLGVALQQGLGGLLNGGDPFSSAIKGAMGFNAGTGQNPMDALTEDLPRVLNNPASILQHGGLEGALKHFAGMDANAGEGELAKALGGDFFSGLGTGGYGGPGADLLGQALGNGDNPLQSLIGGGNPLQGLLGQAGGHHCPFGCIPFA